MRNFLKGFLIGTVCICVIALAWLCLIRPSITAYETGSLKAEYTQPSPGASGSGAGLLPTEEEQPPALDFAALRAQYPDIRAWLTIPGTPIDYPVLQSSITDPEHYLRRNYAGEYRVAGSLFFQADCSLNGIVLVVYGHNMSDGTMFGRLPMYLDSIFCSEHPRIILQTPDGVQQYMVAAVLETDVGQVPFNRTVFGNGSEYLEYARILLDKAKIKTGVPIPADSQLLVLVTCSYSWPDARYVVVAVGS